MSQADPAVFYWRDKDCAGVPGFLPAMWMTSYWEGGTKSFSTTLILQLRSAVQVGHEEHASFCYVGIDIVTVDRKEQIHQENNIKHMQPIHMDPLMNRGKRLPPLGEGRGSAQVKDSSDTLGCKIERA